VSDDPHFAGYRPPARERRPGDLLWTVRRDHVTWTCELFFRGESVGWEAQIFRDGDLRIGRTFVLKDIAIGWADSERQHIQKGDVS
jgi:hypothetical protein